MSIDWVRRAREVNPRICNFVDGRWMSDGSGESIRKYSPRDGGLLYEFRGSCAEEINDAVGAARRAFEDGRWSGLSAQARKDALLRLASSIEQHREELALRECLDVGKPITDALTFDVATAAVTLRYNAEAIEKQHGKVYAVDKASLCYQLRTPIGVVAALVGWNFPLLLAVQKIGSALATGNTLVIKPSELTSLSLARVAELAVQAGVPEGVLNVVHGDAVAGETLARHPDVDLLTFTGSTRTGKRLLIASGESNMKRLILECGGKAPNIVFEDCPPLPAVAESVVARAFWNQGAVCSASSRLLVQESIKEDLLKQVALKAAELTPGDPLKSETTFGALVSNAHKQKVLGYIAGGQREGARMLQQSDCTPPFAGGFYVPPTIFDQVGMHHRLAQEEIFGPVLSVLSFRDEEEAIRIANSTIYGLTAIAWTKDLGRAHRLTHNIRVGSIIVNTTDRPGTGPGEGVVSSGGHKESGIGVEGGLEGLESYMSQTAVQFFV